MRSPSSLLEQATHLNNTGVAWLLKGEHELALSFLQGAMQALCTHSELYLEEQGEPTSPLPSREGLPETTASPPSFSSWELPPLPIQNANVEGYPMYAKALVLNPIPQEEQENDALGHHRQEVSKRRRHRVHPCQVAIVAFNMALVYHHQAAQKEDSCVFRQALAIYEFAYRNILLASADGDIHRLLLPILNNVGNVQCHLVRFDDARLTFQRLRVLLCSLQDFAWFRDWDEAAWFGRPPCPIRTSLEHFLGMPAPAA